MFDRRLGFAHMAGYKPETGMDGSYTATGHTGNRRLYDCYTVRRPGPCNLLLGRSHALLLVCCQQFT